MYPFLQYFLVEPAGEREAKLLNDVLPDAKSPKQGVRIGECTEAVRTTMRRDWGTFNSRIPLPAAFRGGRGIVPPPLSYKKKKKLDEQKLIKPIKWWNRRELNPRPKAP